MDPAALTQQLAAMQQELLSLREQNQRLEQTQQGMEALAVSVAELAKGLQKTEKPKMLFDTKALGKPDKFDSTEDGFRRWARQVTNMVCSVFGAEYEDVLTWVVEQENEVSNSDVDLQFGADPAPVAGIAEASNQLYRLLQHLCTGEAEGIVLNAASGYEAWRRLSRRFDPLSAGRKRNLLRSILSPVRVKSWDNVRQAMDQLDDLVRRYESRKNDAGTREKLSDDLKSTALELLVPTDLEQHLILNKSRLGTYEDMKAEVQQLVEVRSKGAVEKPGVLPTATSSSSGGPAPMDVDTLVRAIGSLVKGGKGKGKAQDGKGKGKGQKGDKGGKKGNQKGSPAKFTGTCDNCGKVGHKKADCWQRAKGGSTDNNKGKGKGKGKGGKNKGKSAAALDETQGQSGEPAQEDELGAVDLGSWESGVNEAAGSWMRFNYDTGAARTAIPDSWKEKGEMKEEKGKEITFKTASGELIGSRGLVRLPGRDEEGHRRAITGALAPVHKPLVSAHRCCSQGFSAVIMEDGGLMVPTKGKLGKKLTRLVEQASGSDRAGCIPLWQENGVYNFYLKAPEQQEKSGFRGQPVA